MRTNFFAFLVIAMALAGLMFAGSGVNAIFGEERSAERLNKQVERQGNDSSVGKGNYSEDASTTNDGTIIGFIIGGVRTLGSIAGLVVLLPIQIQELGFPKWFAYPIGLGVQIITSIGLIQFAANRIYR